MLKICLRLVIGVVVMSVWLQLLAPAHSQTGQADSRKTPPPAESGDLSDLDSIQLKAQSLRRLAQLLERRSERSPEWVQMANALINGEKLGPRTGWYKPSESKFSWEWFQSRFDTDQDQKVTPLEWPRPSFERLDRDADGKLTRLDFDLVNPPRRQDGPLGSFVNNLFAKLDTNSNGKVTAEELTSFLRAADTLGQGFVTREDLLKALKTPRRANPQADEYFPGRDLGKDLDLLLSGGLGSLTAGPALGQPAPEFSLPLKGGEADVALKDLYGKPIVLIFGSFT